MIPLIRNIKVSAHDGWLENLSHGRMKQYCSPLVGRHMQKTLNVLKEFCDEYGMQINATKTTFTGSNIDSTNPIKLGDGYFTRTQIHCHLLGNISSKMISQQVKEEVEHSSVPSFMPTSVSLSI